MKAFKLKYENDRHGTAKFIFPNGSTQEATIEQVLLWEILQELKKKNTAKKRKNNPTKN